MEDYDYAAFIARKDGRRTDFKVVHDDNDFAESVKKWLKERSREKKIEGKGQ